MTIAIGILSILAFAIAFSLSQIVRVARQAISTALTAIAAMRDPALDDARRERLVRRASLTMLGNFASMLLRGTGVLTFACLPVMLADQFGLVSAGNVVGFLSRWDVMLAATLVLGVGMKIKERAWPSR